MLSVSHLTGITPRSEKKVSMFMSETNVGQKICAPNDIVVNTMWAWMSALGVSRHHGIVSPAYGVYRPKNKDTYNPYYMDYLIRTEIYQAIYNQRSTGIRSSRLRLYPDKFLDIHFLLPPRIEQDMIVNFLNRKVFCLNQLLNIQKRQIALFEEFYKTTVNQNIFSITATSVAIKHIAKIYTGNSISVDEKGKKYIGVKGGYPYIATKDVNFNRLLTRQYLFRHYC
jgi:type I restriction enzyme S subunit